MKVLLALLLAITLSGCNSPFDINPSLGVGVQVKIVLYGGRPIHLGDTLTAEIPDLNMVQKSTMNIVYEWHRISGDTESVVTNQSSNGANTYTITSSDLGKSIKVKAVFKYRDSESSSEDIFPAITELSVNNSSDLKNALMSINTSNSVKITADGVFSVSDPIAVPASTELEIKSAVTIDENVTVLDGAKITVSSGNLIVLPGKIFRIEAGGSFNIAGGLALDLHGTFDFSDNAALMINGTVVCNSNSTVVRLPDNYSGNGKFIFSKGCVVYGLIGTGYKIDNYTYANTIEYSKNNNNEIFTVNGDIRIIDAWTISGSLEVRGNVTIDENVTVLNAGKITVSGGNLIVSPGKIFRIETGGSFNIASGLALDLHGTFDFSDDAALMINGTVVCNSNSTVVRLPYNYSGNGKFVFSKGCVVHGLTGAGYKIDNYTYDNTIEYSKNNNNEIFTVNGDIRIIDIWEISGSLEVNGNVSIDPTKDIQGSLMGSKIKVGADAAVTGGVNSLNLTEGTYYWDGDKWYKPKAHAGADQTHTLAHDLTITLDGTGSTGSITAYAWECMSYTADQGTVSAPYTNAAVNALMVNARTATATVAVRKAGTYVFRLTITDSNGGPYTDNVTVTVESYMGQKDVTVSFPVFASGSASLSFTPTYTPAIAGDGFADGDLAYTLEDDMGHTNDDFPDGIVNANLYDDMDMPVFTQIFKIAGVEMDRHSIKAKVVLDLEGESGFESLHDATNDDLLDPQAIPAVDLQLEKTVTELP